MVISLPLKRWIPTFILTHLWLDYLFEGLVTGKEEITKEEYINLINSFKENRLSFQQENDLAKINLRLDKYKNND